MRRLAGLAALALAGCTVGPDYHRPTLAAATAWGGEPVGVASVTSAAAPDPRWWQSFHDPELTSLETRLARQNIDLETAAERVHQSEDQLEITRSQALPHLDERFSYTHERQSPNGFISLVQPAPFAPLTYDIWDEALAASWELDLFGRVRRAVEAQRANTIASIEARHAVALDALANLAQDYIQFRGTVTLEAIARANLVLSRKDLALVQNQFDNGVSTTLALAQAKAQLAATAATLPPLQAEAARLTNAIGLLLAEPPRALERELDAPSVPILIPPVVPVGIPSTLAERRPDIRQAEAELHMATAETGVAVANFYPDVSLTGEFDPQGRMFVNAFSLPSQAYRIGPTVDLPLFQGGRLTGTLRLRRSAQREAALQFRSTVLSAWQDVDNALTAYTDAQAQRAEVAAAVEQDQAALAAARQSFSQGATDFLNVTSAQSTLLTGQNQLAQSDTTIATDLVGLYKALGGGWDVADPEPSAKPPANPS